MRYILIILVVVAVTLLPATPAAAEQPTQAGAESGTVWSATEGEWMPFPDVFPPGGEMKVMRGDPATEAADFYFRFPAGYGVPWHFHTPVEKVYMDQGTVEFTMRDGRTVSVGEGGFVHFPSRAPHKATCTGEDECFFYLSSDGPFDIHLVDEDWNVTRSWPAAQ